MTTGMTNNKTGTMYRALVLCRSLVQAEECQKLIHAAKCTNIQFIYPPSLSQEDLDYVSLYKDCKDLMKEESVDIVVYFHKGLELIHAALVQDSKDLKGASFESAFLCVHRIYNKRYVTTGFNTIFGVITPEDVTQDEVVTILEETGTPVWVRDTFHIDAAIVDKRARSIRGVLKDKEEFHQGLCRTHDLLGDVFQGRIHGPRYDVSELNGKTCVLEEYWDPGFEDISIHIVEGCVVEEDFIPWAISDVLYWKNKPRCIKGITVPSRLEESYQHNVWASTREAVQRLIACGFNDQYIHAKIMLAGNGVVRILDMNASIYVDNLLMHKHVYHNGDSLKAVCDIGLGRMPSYPKLRPLRSAMMGCFTSFQAGHAYEQLRYKLAKANPDVHLLLDETAHIGAKNDACVVLAHVYVFASSYDECEENMTSIMKTLSMENADTRCPWLDT